MSRTISRTSKMVKPGASCVVTILGAVVAVLTDEYSNGTGIRVSGYPFQYTSGTRVFRYPKVRALLQSALHYHCVMSSTTPDTVYMAASHKLRTCPNQRRIWNDGKRGVTQSLATGNPQAKNLLPKFCQVLSKSRCCPFSLENKMVQKRKKVK